MIEDTTITSALFAFGFSTLVPLTVIIYLLARRKIKFFPLFMGACCFIIFQLILRFPILSALSGTSFYGFLQQNSIVMGLFLGLTAGLFEEFGRFAFYKTALQEHNTWIHGFAFGLGFGAGESILTTGLSSVNNFAYMVMINSGTFEDFSQTVDPAVAQQIYDTITQTTALEYLVGGVERILVMVIQLALSLLVLYAVKSKRFSLVIWAVVLHTVVDAPLTFLAGHGMWIAEGYVLLCAVIALWYVVKSRKQFEKIDPKEMRFAPRLKGL